MLAVAFGAAATAAGAPGAITGPSSSDAPYLVRHVPGVTTTSVLTVGDNVGGYRMTGVPDGLGAFDNGDGTFTVLMNHELGSSAGVTRAHGAAGAFVSKWIIRKDTLQVVSGSDLIQRLFVVQNGQYVQATVALNRLCSADLPARSALFNPSTGNGYDGRIFLNGEESTGGRAFGHVVETGDSYQLPAIGNAAFENVVANPATGDRTVVVGTSDGGDQGITVYAGTKTSTGNPVERAGLTNGTALKIAVTGLATESGAAAAPVGPKPFTLAAIGTAWDRPEDASWDPKNPNDLYFVTTASMTKHSRLWHVHFTDVAHPELGGTVEMVLEGPASTSVAGPHMMDNLTVNNRGQVLIQEDPGGNDYLAGIWQYDIATGAVRRIADHDPSRFLVGGSRFDTVDEESSGIIPVPFLGEGKYLLDTQDHTKLADPELVEKGQLQLLHVPPGQKVG